MERKQVTIGSMILCFMLLSSQLAAQELVFEKIPQTEKGKNHFGPNRKNFLHPIASVLTFFPGIGTGSLSIDHPLSGQIHLGARYKYKISKPFAIISDLGFYGRNAWISQNIEKNYPDSVSHESHTIRSAGLTAGLYIRIRMGQPGDYLGNFFDIGLLANAALAQNLVTRDIEPSSEHTSLLTKKTSIRIMENDNPWDVNIISRIGIDRFCLLASWRLTSLLQGTTIMDLPSLQIGIEFAPIRY